MTCTLEYSLIAIIRFALIFFTTFMIVSHTHRYLFLELPLTASTAIAKELIEHYDGKSIYYKHANYRKFLKKASEEEKKYFTFIGIRNPMDQAVSHYYKYLSNHNEKYADIQEVKKTKNPIKHYINQRIHQRKFKYVQEHNPSFSDFFMKFYGIPYSNWANLDKDKMNGVISFEHIQEDFAKVLKDLGIEAKRPLPQGNKTEAKTKHFLEHFDTKESQEKAALVFGPFMKEWGYSFPPEWKVDGFMMQKKGAYDRYNYFKKIFWSLLGK
jgi:hypothetical protein